MRLCFTQEKVIVLDPPEWKIRGGSCALLTYVAALFLLQSNGIQGIQAGSGKTHSSLSRLLHP